MSVVVQHLTKQFGEQRAVDNVSFEAKPGEILGFLGPNGAGKSTTMKIATCYLPPTDGHVSVCGYDVVDQPLEVRQQIGYLPEQNPLYYDMYVHEYLNFAAGISYRKRKGIKSRVKDMIELCGLTVEQSKKIGALSKGYKQRVGLAQALIHDPQVLILDEPTTGLDPNQILEIRQLIKDISREKTVIFSTHIMQEVQALCDRVVIINRGRIVADGAPDTLSAMGEGVTVIEKKKKNPVGEAFFHEIGGVLKVEAANATYYKIQANTDVRERIFLHAAANKVVLLGMKMAASNMEDVFRQLTKTKNNV